jgi:hypothetical protein
MIILALMCLVTGFLFLLSVIIPFIGIPLLVLWIICNAIAIPLALKEIKKRKVSSKP